MSGPQTLQAQFRDLALACADTSTSFPHYLQTFSDAIYPLIQQHSPYDTFVDSPPLTTLPVFPVYLKTQDKYYKHLCKSLTDGIHDAIMQCIAVGTDFYTNNIDEYNTYLLTFKQHFETNVKSSSDKNNMEEGSVPTFDYIDLNDIRHVSLIRKKYSFVKNLLLLYHVLLFISTVQYFLSLITLYIADNAITDIIVMKKLILFTLIHVCNIFFIDVTPLVLPNLQSIVQDNSLRIGINDTSNISTSSHVNLNTSLILSDDPAIIELLYTRLIQPYINLFIYEHQRSFLSSTCSSDSTPVCFQHTFNFTQAITLLNNVLDCTIHIYTLYIIPYLETLVFKSNTNTGSSIMTLLAAQDTSESPSDQSRNVFEIVQQFPSNIMVLISLFTKERVLPKIFNTYSNSLSSIQCPQLKGRINLLSSYIFHRDERFLVNLGGLTNASNNNNLILYQIYEKYRIDNSLEFPAYQTAQLDYYQAIELDDLGSEKNDSAIAAIISIQHDYVRKIVKITTLDDFYYIFWSIQEIFNNPKKLENKDILELFLYNMSIIINFFLTQNPKAKTFEFKSTLLKENTDTTSSESVDNSISIDIPFFPRYLVSQTLFPLQLYDSDIRISVLFQFLFLTNTIFIASTHSDEIPSTNPHNINTASNSQVILPNPFKLGRVLQKYYKQIRLLNYRCYKHLSTIYYSSSLNATPYGNDNASFNLGDEMTQHSLVHLHETNNSLYYQSLDKYSDTTALNRFSLTKAKLFPASEDANTHYSISVNNINYSLDALLNPYGSVITTGYSSSGVSSFSTSTSKSNGNSNTTESALNTIDESTSMTDSQTSDISQLVLTLNLSPTPSEQASTIYSRDATAILGVIQRILRLTEAVWMQWKFQKCYAILRHKTFHSSGKSFLLEKKPVQTHETDTISSTPPSNLHNIIYALISPTHRSFTTMTQSRIITQYNNMVSACLKSADTGMDEDVSLKHSPLEMISAANIIKNDMPLFYIQSPYQFNPYYFSTHHYKFIKLSCADATFQQQPYPVSAGLPVSILKIINPFDYKNRIHFADTMLLDEYDYKAATPKERQQVMNTVLLKFSSNYIISQWLSNITSRQSYKYYQIPPHIEQYLITYQTAFRTKSIQLFIEQLQMQKTTINKKIKQYEKRYRLALHRKFKAQPSNRNIRPEQMETTMERYYSKIHKKCNILRRQLAMVTLPNFNVEKVISPQLTIDKDLIADSNVNFTIILPNILKTAPQSNRTITLPQLSRIGGNYLEISTHLAAMNKKYLKFNKDIVILNPSNLGAISVSTLLHIFIIKPYTKLLLLQHKKLDSATQVALVKKNQKLYHKYYNLLFFKTNTPIVDNIKNLEKYTSILVSKRQYNRILQNCITMSHIVQLNDRLDKNEDISQYVPGEIDPVTQSIKNKAFYYHPLSIVPYGDAKVADQFVVDKFLAAQYDYASKCVVSEQSYGDNDTLESVYLNIYSAAFNDCQFESVTQQPLSDRHNVNPSTKSLLSTFFAQTDAQCNDLVQFDGNDMMNANVSNDVYSTYNNVLNTVQSHELYNVNEYSNNINFSLDDGLQIWNQCDLPDIYNNSSTITVLNSIFDSPQPNVTSQKQDLCFTDTLAEKYSLIHMNKLQHYQQYLNACQDYTDYFSGFNNTTEMVDSNPDQSHDYMNISLNTTSLDTSLDFNTSATYHSLLNNSVSDASSPKLFSTTATNSIPFYSTNEEYYFKNYISIQPQDRPHHYLHYYPHNQQIFTSNDDIHPWVGFDNVYMTKYNKYLTHNMLLNSFIPKLYTRANDFIYTLHNNIQQRYQKYSLYYTNYFMISKLLQAVIGFYNKNTLSQQNINKVIESVNVALFDARSDIYYNNSILKQSKKDDIDHEQQHTSTVMDNDQNNSALAAYHKEKYATIFTLINNQLLPQVISDSNNANHSQYDSPSLTYQQEFAYILSLFNLMNQHNAFPFINIHNMMSQYMYAIMKHCSTMSVLFPLYRYLFHTTNIRIFNALYDDVYYNKIVQHYNEQKSPLGGLYDGDRFNFDTCPDNNIPYYTYITNQPIYTPKITNNFDFPTQNQISTKLLTVNKYSGINTPQNTNLAQLYAKNKSLLLTNPHYAENGDLHDKFFTETLPGRVNQKLLKTALSNLSLLYQNFKRTSDPTIDPNTMSTDSIDEKKQDVAPVPSVRRNLDDIGSLDDMDADDDEDNDDFSTPLATPFFAEKYNNQTVMLSLAFQVLKTCYKYIYTNNDDPQPKNTNTSTIDNEMTAKIALLNSKLLLNFMPQRSTVPLLMYNSYQYHSISSITRKSSGMLASSSSAFSSPSEYDHHIADEDAGDDENDTLTISKQYLKDYRKHAKNLMKQVIQHRDQYITQTTTKSSKLSKNKPEKNTEPPVVNEKYFSLRKGVRQSFAATMPLHYFSSSSPRNHNEILLLPHYNHQYQYIDPDPEKKKTYTTQVTTTMGKNSLVQTSLLLYKLTLTAPLVQKTLAKPSDTNSDESSGNINCEQLMHTFAIYNLFPTILLSPISTSTFPVPSTGNSGSKSREFQQLRQTFLSQHKTVTNYYIKFLYMLLQANTLSYISTSKPSLSAYYTLNSQQLTMLYNTMQYLYERHINHALFAEIYPINPTGSPSESPAAPHIYQIEYDILLKAQSDEKEVLALLEKSKAGHSGRRLIDKSHHSATKTTTSAMGKNSAPTSSANIKESSFVLSHVKKSSQSSTSIQATKSVGPTKTITAETKPTIVRSGGRPNKNEGQEQVPQTSNKSTIEAIKSTDTKVEMNKPGVVVSAPQLTLLSSHNNSPQPTIPQTNSTTQFSHPSAPVIQRGGRVSAESAQKGRGQTLATVQTQQQQQRQQQQQQQQQPVSRTNPTKVHSSRSGQEAVRAPAPPPGLVAKRSNDPNTLVQLPAPTSSVIPSTISSPAPTVVTTSQNYKHSSRNVQGYQGSEQHFPRDAQPQQGVYHPDEYEYGGQHSRRDGRPQSQYDNRAQPHQYSNEPYHYSGAPSQPHHQDYDNRAQHLPLYTGAHEPTADRRGQSNRGGQYNDPHDQRNASGRGQVRPRNDQDSGHPPHHGRTRHKP